MNIFTEENESNKGFTVESLSLCSFEENIKITLSWLSGDLDIKNRNGGARTSENKKGITKI